MRLATVISLLLFACAACALQQHPEERRDGFRLSVPRRSFRRRLASRRIGSSIGPDIAPRGIQMNRRSPSHILSELKLWKTYDRITSISIGHEGTVHVYRVHSLLPFKGPVVVKEISVTKHNIWDKKTVEMEVRGARAADALYAVLEEGETYFILMKNLGNKWDSHFQGDFSATDEAMFRAITYYRNVYLVKRNVLCGPDDYAWTLSPHYGWVAQMAGKWRYVTLIERHDNIPKDRHYCGIKEWDKDGLPIFSMDDTEYYTG